MNSIQVHIVMVTYTDECKWKFTGEGQEVECTKCKRKSKCLKNEQLDEKCPMASPQPIGWAVWCPGCDCHHRLVTKKHGKDNVVIVKFNGNLLRPTFSPDITVKGNDTEHKCHFTIRQGYFEYFSDCSHPFRGMKVPLSSRPLTQETK